MKKYFSKEKPAGNLFFSWFEICLNPKFDATILFDSPELQVLPDILITLEKYTHLTR